VAGVLMACATLLFARMDSLARHLGRGFGVLPVVRARYAFHLAAMLALVLAGFGRGRLLKRVAGPGCRSRGRRSC